MNNDRFVLNWNRFDVCFRFVRSRSHTFIVLLAKELFFGVLELINSRQIIIEVN